MTIDELSTLDAISAGDLLPLYDSSNGDARKASISLLLAYMQANITSSASVPQFDTQYYAPNATAFSVQITDSSDNTHLILTPTAGFAAGTIVLPAVLNCIDKQEILVNCTQDITALTIDDNGAASVVGAPTGITANDFFRLKYDSLTTNWYRVG